MVCKNMASHFKQESLNLFNSLQNFMIGINSESPYKVLNSYKVGYNQGKIKKKKQKTKKLTSQYIYCWLAFVGFLFKTTWIF